MTSGDTLFVGLIDQGNCVEMMPNQNRSTPSFALYFSSEQICQDDELSFICESECSLKREICLFCVFQQVWEHLQTKMIFSVLFLSGDLFVNSWGKYYTSRERDTVDSVCVLGVNLDYCHVDLMNLISVNLLHALHSFLYDVSRFESLFINAVVVCQTRRINIH